MVMVQVKPKRMEKHTQMFPKAEKNSLMWEIIHSPAVCGCKKAPDRQVNTVLWLICHIFSLLYMAATDCNFADLRV